MDIKLPAGNIADVCRRRQTTDVLSTIKNSDNPMIPSALDIVRLTIVADNLSWNRCIIDRGQVNRWIFM